MGFINIQEIQAPTPLQIVVAVRIVHICEKRPIFLVILLQSAEFWISDHKLFLTGIGASGLTVILSLVEQRRRGERT